MKDLRVSLASLPQAPAEHVPEDHSEGQVAWDKGVLKIALGQKVQGPHGVPPEGESEDPPELSAGTLRYAYNCTFPCPTEESIQQKHLKKPGTLSRYDILMLVLDAVAKTNELRQDAPPGQRQGRKVPLYLKFVVVFQELRSSHLGHCLQCSHRMRCSQSLAPACVARVRAPRCGAHTRLRDSR